MLGGSTRQRVSRLESSVEELRGDFAGMSGKIDKVLDQVTGTDGRAAERAHAVKLEMREEVDRKSKERSSAAMIGFGLLSAIALIVAALTGPWKEKLETTAAGQSADTAAISAVREVLAQQGAAIGRNGDALTISREKNMAQDEQLRTLQHDQAYQAGWMTARLGYPGH